MSRLNYTAILKDGSTVTGQATAADLSAVITSLAGDGFYTRRGANPVVRVFAANEETALFELVAVDGVWEQLRQGR